MNKLSMSIKSFAVLILESFYMLCYGVWLYTAELSRIENYAEILFPWIVAAMLVQMCCFLVIKKVTAFDMGLWFVVLSYLFMYGYLFIDYFELESSLLWTPIREYSQTVLFESASFVNFSLNMFTLGYLLFYKKDKESVETRIDLRGSNDAKKCTIGILLCVIGGICHIITSLSLIIVTQKAGAYTAYTQAASSGLVDDISFLLVPGIAYVLTSKKLTGAKALLLTGLIVVYFSVIMLLSGSRKTQVFGIVAVALCYLDTYKTPKVKLYKKILIVFGGAVFLNMIYIIREYRMDLAQVVPAFFESITTFEFLTKLIPEVLAETGITFCSVVSVVYCVPRVFGFEYGMSFIRSIVSVIPIGWLIPDFFAKAATTTTINKYMNLPVGSSMLADFYWNWGYFGVVAAFAMGAVLSTCFVKLHKESREIYYSVLYIVLIGVRAGIFELVRPLFIVVFVPWFLGRIMERR